MFYMPLLAAVQARSTDWSIGVGITMLLCNLFAIAIGRYAISRKGVGPKLPIQFPDPFGGEFGLPELLATASFGHILGAGAILGLTNAGIL
ncbi:photosystem I reaction center subunit PsaK [Phormidium sp. CLA17]|uniref:photosystem I reaction center subunit PsaK n=1 Tax=Leptolyngbya sp. Cla-17 TaxID=2803751 RepID=UPI001491E068|nr:photosystem I reaction center subunit PsaK [Leptolyngbya sp. Cla-17]MBM0741783.1 photosystem I reaction center subunit PsaK [Leptolyngbya sp. Cla-17]